MQQAQEADTKAEAQGGGVLGFKDKGGIIKLEFVQGVAQFREVITLDGEDPRVHHGIGMTISRQSIKSWLDYRGDSISDARLTHILHAGNEVTHLTHAERISFQRLRRNDANFQDLMGGARGHHENALSVVEFAVHDPDIGHNTAIGVIDRIENEGPRRSIGITLRRRNLAHNLIQ